MGYKFSNFKKSLEYILMFLAEIAHGIFFLVNMVHEIILIISLFRADQIHQIAGIILCVVASSAVDRGFEPRPGRTKYYDIGICWFSDKHTLLNKKIKYGFSRNQDNVSKWSDMSTRWLDLVSLHF
jgi:hypothetical protein